jgi:hypothetical protein
MWLRVADRSDIGVPPDIGVSDAEADTGRGRVAHRLIHRTLTSHLFTKQKQFPRYQQILTIR